MKIKHVWKMKDGWHKLTIDEKNGKVYTFFIIDHNYEITNDIFEIMDGYVTYLEKKRFQDFIKQNRLRILTWGDKIEFE